MDQGIKDAVDFNREILIPPRGRLKRCGRGREVQAQAGATDASKIQLGFDTFESAMREKLA